MQSYLKNYLNLFNFLRTIGGGSMVNFLRILDSERHIAFCPANFVADIYIGCPHACWYCYAPSFSRPAKFEKSFENFRLFKPRLKERHIEKIGEAIKTANPKGLCDPRKERIIEEKYSCSIKNSFADISSSCLLRM